MTTDGRLRAEKERLRALCYVIISRPVAGVAQLVEHVIRNDGVGSSNLFAGTTVSRSSRSPRPDLVFPAHQTSKFRNREYPFRQA